MALDPLHESHIRSVGVTFELIETDLDPTAVSTALGIAADDSARRGDIRRNYGGQLLRPHNEGWWAIRSEGKVRSKDINDHFRYLLDILLPHKEVICEFIASGEVSFGVVWQSTYLYAGTGPMLDRDVIAGVASLGADLAFDIYQINEAEREEEV